MGTLRGKTWRVRCPQCERDVIHDPKSLRAHCAACDYAFVPAEMPTAAIRRKHGDEIAVPAHPWTGKTLGPWTIVRHLGDGGMGQVFEARGKKGRTRVALKVLRSELSTDPKFVKRFHREARVLKSLSHPHIVAMLDQGEDDGLLWIAMEYVRGETLRHVMARGTMSMKTLSHLGSQIGSALDYAHKKGVIHRDLKPENVIVDEQGDVHLVDFGLSKLHETTLADNDSRLTRTDVIMGTYEYMAPEHRRGDQKLDARADVFSYGVLLYEMATGSLPLGRFALPSELRSELPTELDEIVSKALATNPKDRYGAASDMAISLHECAGMKKSRRCRWSRKKDKATVTPASEGDIADARRMLRHVELVASLDRVVAILFLLAGTIGVPFVREFISFPSVPTMTGLSLVLIIIGVMLWKQGKALSRMQPGSRSRQITASAFMCLLPPVIIFGGIYGLIVMTSDRARRAFRLGKDALLDDDQRVEPTLPAKPRPKHAPMPFAPRAAPKDFGIGMRIYALCGVLLSLYAVLVCTSVELFGRSGGSGSDILTVRPSHDGILSMSSSDIHDFGGVMLVACFVSVLVLLYTFARRRVVRGWGLAFVIASFVFGASYWLHHAATSAGFASPLFGHAL